jgi:hypothetical protein
VVPKWEIALSTAALKIEIALFTAAAVTAAAMRNKKNKQNFTIAVTAAMTDKKKLNNCSDSRNLRWLRQRP